MRTMLGAMTALAVLCAAFSWLGISLLAVLTGIWLLAAAIALGTLGVYCRGPRQTFFAAAFVGWIATLYAGPAMSDSFGSAFSYLFAAALPVIGALLSAVVAVFTRRFLERRGWHLPGQEKP
jgi:hypothetical protein